MTLLDNLCYHKDKTCFLDYTFFKQLANKETYPFIIQFIVNNIDAILTENDQFDVHVSLKQMTIGDVDKHFEFWRDMSSVLKIRYKNKLNRCYVYDIQSFFSKCYNVVKVFIDKDTQEKIQLIKK